MTPKFLTACEAFQPAEQACWEILLRELPGGREIPDEALRGAIERSLEQLWSLLRANSPARWLRRQPSRQAVTWLPKGCGLEPVLDFFGTGQRAVELIVSEIEKTFPASTDDRRGRHRDEIRRAIDILVQRELDQLCAPCKIIGHCPLSGQRVFGEAKSKARRGDQKTTPAKRR